MPYVRVSEFWIPKNFCLWIEIWSPEKLCSWNTESWALESGMLLKAFGIPLTTGIQSPSSIDKDWNPLPRIQNLESRFQDCFGFPYMGRPLGNLKILNAAQMDSIGYMLIARKAYFSYILYVRLDTLIMTIFIEDANFTLKCFTEGSS